MIGGQSDQVLDRFRWQLFSRTGSGLGGRFLFWVGGFPDWGFTVLIRRLGVQLAILALFEVFELVVAFGILGQGLIG